MSRINYTDEEDWPGQFFLWQSNCERSLRGKKGQAELRLLREALLALPEKVLICGTLVDEEEHVCAVAAYARHKGIDLAKFDPEEKTDAVGIAAGMPKLTAWKVVEMNDIEFPSWISPEERYKKMLAWVEEHIEVKQ